MKKTTKEAKPEPKQRGRKLLHESGTEVVALRYPVAWMDLVRQIATDERREAAQVMRIALEDFLRARGALK